MGILAILLIIASVYFGVKMILQSASIPFAEWVPQNWVNIVVGVALLVFAVLTAIRLFKALKKQSDKAKEHAQTAYEERLEKAAAIRRSKYLDDDIDPENIEDTVEDDEEITEDDEDAAEDDEDTKDTDSDLDAADEANGNTEDDTE